MHGTTVGGGNITQYRKVTSIGLCPGHHQTQNSTYPDLQ